MAEREALALALRASATRKFATRGYYQTSDTIRIGVPLMAGPEGPKGSEALWRQSP